MIQQKTRIKITVEAVLLENNKVMDARTIAYKEVFLETIEEFLNDCKTIIENIHNPFKFLER